jgi:hypothetical protein
MAPSLPLGYYSAGPVVSPRLAGYRRRALAGVGSSAPAIYQTPTAYSNISPITGVRRTGFGAYQSSSMAGIHGRGIAG